ncbi:hypothetical protein Ancab_039532 [Ancistrocladus abbreviatus]
MILLSLNCRGLESAGMRRDIRRLATVEKANFLLLQETKKEGMTELFCRSLKRTSQFDWVVQGARGLAGGMLCSWDTSVFVKSGIFEGDGYFDVSGSICFSQVNLGSVVKRSAIFGATVWALWLSRNALIFRREELSVGKLLDLIRFMSFEWARFRCNWGGFSFVQWECNPRKCFS